MVLSNLTIALAAGALFSAVLATWSQAASRRRLHFVTKPLTTGLIVAVAAAAAAPVPAAYKTLVLTGLAFSLLGDIALMFPDRWFTGGLVFFLAAQVSYILAFKPLVAPPLSPEGMILEPNVPAPAAFLPFVLFGLLMFFLLAPKLGPMKIPVFIYIAAITTMAGFAAVRYIYRGGTKSLLAFIGAVLFLVSDSVLAYDRFARKVPGARIIILGTYFPAQLLIALSI